MSLESMWNSNWRLSRTFKYVVHKGLPFTKEQCVAFYRASYKLLGSCGSYPEPVKEYHSPKTSRRDLIAQYSVNTGMFGSYASWLGYSVSYFLKQAGYEPLTEEEQRRYNTY